LKLYPGGFPSTKPLGKGFIQTLFCTRSGQLSSKNRYNVPGITLSFKIRVTGPGRREESGTIFLK
jgi:hypothetical protein